MQQSFYLYYTSSCIIEANERKQGQLNDLEIRKIREFIKDNYKDIYLKWREIADTGFYGEN